MAWTSPKTWVSGELVTDEDMNAQLRDNLLILKTSIDNNGKIVALSSTYFASLDGSALTGLLRTGVGNDITAGKQNFNGGATTRLVIPVGADKWAT